MEFCRGRGPRRRPSPLPAACLPALASGLCGPAKCTKRAACWGGDHDCDACAAAARARDAEAFKGGMTVKEINAAFGERAGELKKPAKRVGLIDMGLIHLFMM